MLRRSSLLLFLGMGLIVPLSCSNDAKDGSPAGGGGTGGGDLIGLGGEGGGSGQVCEEFSGLGPSCGSNAVTAETMPINMLLVLDKSGSMATPPEPGSDVSLWDATRSALSVVLAEAPEAVSFGLQMYPSRDLKAECGDNCCDMPGGQDLDVPIGSSAGTRTSIVQVLDTTTPGGGTPTAAALARAYEYFSSGEGAQLKGDRYILLATDGGPNCNSDASCTIDACTVNLDGQCPDAEVNCCASRPAGCLDDAQTLDQIEKLREIGVDTFVVGLTGTEQYADQLDEFAEAGGRPRQGTPEKYYKVDAEGSADGLVRVFSEITKQLVQSCEVTLAEKPSKLNEVNVAVDCEIIPSGVPEGDGGNGSGGSGNPGGQGGEGGSSLPFDPQHPSYWWMDESTDPPVIRIGGDICDMIQSQGVERIDVILGCPTVR